MIIAVFGKNPVEAGKFFIKLASSALKLENAIGIYKAPTVMPKEEFLSGSEYLKEEGELPVQNLGT